MRVCVCVQVIIILGCTVPYPAVTTEQVILHTGNFYNPPPSLDSERRPGQFPELIQGPQPHTKELRDVWLQGLPQKKKKKRGQKLRKHRIIRHSHGRNTNMHLSMIFPFESQLLYDLDVPLLAISEHLHSSLYDWMIIFYEPLGSP